MDSVSRKCQQDSNGFLYHGCQALIKMIGKGGSDSVGGRLFNCMVDFGTLDSVDPGIVTRDAEFRIYHLGINDIRKMVGLHDIVIGVFRLLSGSGVGLSPRREQ